LKLDKVRDFTEVFESLNYEYGLISSQSSVVCHDSEGVVAWEIAQPAQSLDWY